MVKEPQSGSETPESMALILRNGGSQSPDRWLWEGRNNHTLTLKGDDPKLAEILAKQDSFFGFNYMNGIINAR